MPETKRPLLAHLTRVLIVAQTVVAASIATLALGLTLAAYRSDVVASRAGENPDGFGVALGTFMTILTGTFAVLLAFAAVGVLRDKLWGRIVAGIAELALLMLALEGGPFLLGRLSTGVIPLVVGVPAAIVLAGVVHLPGRQVPSPVG